MRFEALPPSARDRVERQRASGVAGSLLSAPAVAALRAVDLEPAGEVFGCVVQQLGWTNNACGVWGTQASAGILAGPGSPGWTTPVQSTATAGGRFGLTPYVRAFEQGWETALGRMTAEASALGAIGVVGVRIGRSRLAGQAQEFSALGTAVRHVRTRPAPGGPVWTAELSGEDCAAALLSGREPTGIVLGLAVATKHEDVRTRQQRTSWSNTEITGLTELVQTARIGARLELTRRAARLGGGEVVVSRMGLSEFETACGQESDQHAESVLIGTGLRPTGLAPFRTAQRPGDARVLPVVPLTDATARSSARRL